MPFTLAHPAIIIPLQNKKWFCFNALVVGSIIPDFEFYLQLREVQNIGHSLFGILVFDIPFGLLVRFIYLYFVTNFVQSWFTSNTLLTKENKITNKSKTTFLDINIITSLLIGILSHLLLDGFTHYDGFVVKYFTSLNTTISFYTKQYPLYTANQIILSIIGSLIVIYRIVNAKILEHYILPIKYTSLLYTILLAAVIFITRILVYTAFNNFWGVVIAFIGSIIYALIIASVFYKFKTNKKHLA